MTVLDELYGLEIGDCCYRHTLKKWFQENFPEQLLFLAPRPTKTEVALNSSTLMLNISLQIVSNIISVAEQLRDDIINHKI